VLNLGLHWAAGVASPANPTYTVDELARQLQDCGARAVVTQAPYLEAVLKAASQVGLGKENVLLMGDDKVDGFRHWRDVAKDGEGRHEIGKPAVEPKKDLAYLVYSSVSLILVLVLVLAMMCAK
jgi:4-coumarate--CoA ligase